MSFLVDTDFRYEPATYQASILWIAGWIILGVTGLGVIGRSAVKAAVIRQIGYDDVFIWLAYVSA